MDLPTALQDKSKDELIVLLLAREAVVETAETGRAAAEAEVDKLHLLIKQLQRALYGPRSERLDPDQLQLALEDGEQSLGTAEAVDEAAGGETKPKRRRTARRNRGALPKHLPREEVVIEPEQRNCPCCDGALHVIGEDVSEQLDVVPAQFKVKVIRRPRYGCRACEGAVVQAPAPARLVEGGMPTEAMVAHVVISKYLDHLPLYRQAQIYSRQGIDLDRSTLANWVGRAAWWLEPIHARLMAEITGSAKIFADDTPVPVLDPGRGPWARRTISGPARPEGADQDGSIVGLRSRRPAVARRRSTGGRLCLYDGPPPSPPGRPSRGLLGHAASRRLRRLRYAGREPARRDPGALLGACAT
jgi:transposase